MENKITLQKLATLLALASGKELNLCEDFLTGFFQIIEESLSRGENVRIRGFGTFKLVEVDSRKSVNVATGREMEIAAHRKVVFVPSRELADKVNEAFSMFEAMEVSDSIPTSELTEPEQPEPEQPEPEQPEPEQTESNPPSLEEACGMEETTAAQATSESAETSEPEIEPDEWEGDTESRGNSLKFLWGFLAGVALCGGVAFGLWWFGVLPLEWKHTGTVEPTNQAIETLFPEEGLESDSIAVPQSLPGGEDGKDGGRNVATVPSDTQAAETLVYDTITQTRYLTTMARDHYGNFNLWPIIYEENKSFLGHPDRIKPGTRVVIPSLAKYGVDPKNQADIRRIKHQGTEIYKRYK